METVTNILETLRRMLPRIGPYLVVEIALPGGSLLALLLYLYRRRLASFKRSPLRTAARGAGQPA